EDGTLVGVFYLGAIEADGPIFGTEGRQPIKLDPHLDGAKWSTTGWLKSCEERGGRIIIHQPRFGARGVERLGPLRPQFAPQRHEEQANQPWHAPTGCTHHIVSLSDTGFPALASHGVLARRREASCALAPSVRRADRRAWAPSPTGLPGCAVGH